MTTTPEQLLDELVARWARGEPLEVEMFLVRAGPRADELAVLVDKFLQRAPRMGPTPSALAFVRSLDEPSLLTARQARQLKLDDLVAGLVKMLELPSSSREKVRSYYQRLELGQLDPAGVAVSVWVALAELLGRDARGLAAVPPLPPAAAPMYRRADYSAALLQAVSRDEPDAPGPGPEPDEVDRLFGIDP